jgi:molybdopterin-guanine dinucleotide biosynthesis protein A
MAVAGIVLCGGASRRMGQPKAWLDFNGEPLLCRVVRIVAQVTSTVIVVAGPNQSLPELPGGVIITRDPVEHQGPLVGLSAGLTVAPTNIDHCFVTACDAPFLTTGLIQLLINRAQPDRALLPLIDGARQPLPAIYPVNCANAIQSLVETGERSLRSLWQVMPIDELHESEIRAVDPTLAAFRPLNHPDDYVAALAQQ